MEFYETKKCSEIFKKLKLCPDSILPSSMETERCFSAAGLFTSKLQSSLSDEMIDSLCFVQSFLKNKIFFAF